MRLEYLSLSLPHLFLLFCTDKPGWPVREPSAPRARMLQDSNPFSAALRTVAILSTGQLTPAALTHSPTPALPKMFGLEQTILVEGVPTQIILDSVIKTPFSCSACPHPWVLAVLCDSPGRWRWQRASPWLRVATCCCPPGLSPARVALAEGTRCRWQPGLGSRSWPTGSAGSFHDSAEV